MSGDLIDQMEQHNADWLRKRGWTCTPPNPNAVLDAGRNAPDTSIDTIAKMRGSSLRAKIMYLFDVHGVGYTDEEIELHFTRSHASVSAARNTLVAMGLLYPTEYRRKTRAGNKAIVWARTERKWTT